jgi:hypothetical protein
MMHFFLRSSVDAMFRMLDDREAEEAFNMMCQALPERKCTGEYTTHRMEPLHVDIINMLGLYGKVGYAQQAKKVCRQYISTNPLRPVGFVRAMAGVSIGPMLPLRFAAECEFCTMLLTGCLAPVH